jgi:hypothetical protein
MKSSRRVRGESHADQDWLEAERETCRDLAQQKQTM